MCHLLLRSVIATQAGHIATEQQSIVFGVQLTRYSSYFTSHSPPPSASAPSSFSLLHPHIRTDQAACACLPTYPTAHPLAI